MKKFDRLLEKIKLHDGVELDVGDFGLNQENLKQLVEEINNNQKIKILVLQHNSLGDESVKFLIQLEHITSLDISYNNFTQTGIDELEKMLKEKCSSFRIYKKCNNTSLLVFSNPTMYTSTQEQATIDAYAATLAKAVHVKLLEINPSPEQLSLVRDRFIQILDCDNKIFALESQTPSSNVLTNKVS